MISNDISSQLHSVNRVIDDLIDAVRDKRMKPDRSWAIAMDTLLKKAARLRGLLESTS